MALTVAEEAEGAMEVPTPGSGPPTGVGSKMKGRTGGLTKAGGATESTGGAPCSS